MRHASSKIDPKKAPAKRGNGPDLLSPKTWRWLLPLLAALIIGARFNRGVITPVVAVLLVRYCAALGDAWEGEQRQRGGLKATILAGLLFGMYWPAPWPGWWLIPYIAIPIALAVYATRTIGQSGNESRQQAKVTTAFNAASKYLPPEVEQRGKATVKDGTTKVRFKAPAGTSGWKPEIAARNIASVAGVTRDKVTIVDLGNTVESDLYELQVRTRRPFELDTDPVYPDRSSWPDNCIPLGWDSNGETVWIDVPAMEHTLVSGRTRWGKSNTLHVIINGLTTLGTDLVLIDPKRGAELSSWGHLAGDNFARSPEEAEKLLKHMLGVMATRYDAMQGSGRNVSDAEWITIVMDEAAQVMARKAAKAASLSLAQMALASRIRLIYATQYPTDELFGSALKQNIGTVITHRLKDSTGSNVAVGQGAKGDGWDASKLPVKGRAIVELPHLATARQMVQVFLAPQNSLSARVHPHSMGHTQAERPVDTLDAGQAGRPLPAPLPPPGLPDLGQYGAAILTALGDAPVSARDVAERVRCSPTTASNVLKKARHHDLAKQRDGGWVRA